MNSAARTRLIVGYLAIAMILPYFLLKIAWIMGSTIGIARVSPLDAEVVQGGNVITAAMEVLAGAIILAFTHSWGSRVPAWLVLPPVWVAIGLLTPFVFTGPVVAVSVLSDPRSVGDGTLAPWVGPVVYGSFGAQGVGVAVAFVLYARDRWPQVLRSRIAVLPKGRNRPALVVFAWLVTGLCVLIAIVRSFWALGSTWGLPDRLVLSRGFADHVAEAGTALFALAAAAGLLALVQRRPRHVSTGVPIALAWIGGGAVFGSGVYPLVLLLTEIAGSGESAMPVGVEPFVDLIQTLTGTVIAVVGAVLLAELAGRDEDIQSVRFVDRMQNSMSSG
ncbi:hypothetical protein [Brevibacterium sp.]|uniref:hypothetical protein n=1 Tax=Brevibacterium sp. TaxID=1701 RepID=UPI002810B7CD|nr:hypothetical protein [Brevibacterium sp.]